MIVCDRSQILSDEHLIRLFQELDTEERQQVYISDMRTIFQVSKSRLNC